MLPAGTIACARCGKHLPSIATFCDGCGNRIAPIGAGPAAGAIGAQAAVAIGAGPAAGAIGAQAGAAVGAGSAPRAIGAQAGAAIGAGSAPRAIGAQAGAAIGAGSAPGALGAGWGAGAIGARAGAVGAKVAAGAIGAAPFASARPGFVAAGRGMAICHGCGAIAPLGRSTCEVCDAPIGSSLEAIPPRSDGAVWVQIRSELVCRQCGQRSPLDPLEFDATVTCGRCGALQAFDPSAWQDALAHAHAVGDLARVPDLEGRNASLAGRNPFADIGTARAAAEHVSSGVTIEAGVMKTRNVAISAAPGHPLCSRCGVPLEIESRGDEVATRCQGCGESSRHRFPVEALSLASGLLAAIGDELRIDRPAARLEATSAGAVIALRCPSCGAALTPQGSAHFVSCAYCQTHCRIPQRTLLALRQGSPKPDPWWALFRGPSPMRRELLEGGAPAILVSDDPDDEDDRPRRRRRKKLEMIEQPPLSRTPRDEGIAWALQIAIPIFFVAAVGAVLHGPLLLKWAQGFASHEVPTEPR